MKDKKRQERGSITELIPGRCRITVSADNTLEVLNVLLGTGAVYREFEDSVTVDDPEGGSRSVTRFVVSHYTAKLLSELFEKRGIEASSESLWGLPHVLNRYKMRIGLWIGLAAALAIIVLGNSVLWEVQITGNESVPSEKIVSLLAQYGVCPGARKKDIDIDTVRSDVERESSDIAWLSINVSGTVAFVQVREEHSPQEQTDADCDGVNLVASRDGVVTGYVLSGGRPVPQIGATVKRGELLVTGIIENERMGLRIVRAAGEVMARTTHTVSVTVPLVYEESIPEKRKIVGISLFFFGYEQKLFKNYGNEGSFCDTIKSVWYVYKDDRHTVPAGLVFETEMISEKTEKNRTEEEARALARLELSRKIAAETAGMTVLRSAVNESATENGITLICEMDCNENIALPVPFVLGGE